MRFHSSGAEGTFPLTVRHHTKDTVEAYSPNPSTSLLLASAPNHLSSVVL